MAILIMGVLFFSFQIVYLLEFKFRLMRINFDPNHLS
jgi:hypothetical protein